jgi:alginate O-acetyltransferase complex protein AlgI
MAFNTLHFVYFFSAFLVLYWLFRKNLLLQNLLIIIASYGFYAFAKYEAPFDFLKVFANYKLPCVLAIVSIFTFFTGLVLEKANNKKPILYGSLLLLLIQLFYFKYANWIFDFKTTDLWYQLRNTIGISYFTLAAYSYLVDINRGKISAEKNIISLLSYLSFFPHLLSGPIPIAHLHLGQFSVQKTIDYFKIETAFQRIAWGLFKKVIISGMLASEVNYVFYNQSTLGVLYLWLGIILYSFQVYMDFSGYSDMAFGISKLLGFNISPNFKSPFISTSIDEFWRRWHLSLSTWLREYVYIPLGGRGNSKLHYIVVILIVFTVSGLWHGANATFVLWGFFNGLLFVLSILFGFTPSSKIKTYHWYDVFKIILVFVSISFTRVLFHSADLEQATAYYKNMFVFTNLQIPDIGIKALLFSVGVVIIEFLQKNRDNASDVSHMPLIIRLLLYGIIIALIWFLWPVINSTEYIYFKF